MADEDMEECPPPSSTIVSQPSSPHFTGKRPPSPSPIVSQPSTKHSRRKSPSPSGNKKSSITSRVTPRKSPLDPNSYRIIKLSSGLTVFLISREKMESKYSPQRMTLNPAKFGLGLFPSSTLPTNDAFAYHHLIETPNSSFLSEVNSIFSSFPIDFPDDSDPSHAPIYRPEESETSVAVIVNVGAFQDPLKSQGLAHFTEHMVHYGSKKYPKENQYDLLITNFGVFNAYTTYQVTCYFNQVPDSLLHSSLDIYTEMLTNPLFREDTLEREVQAVDNEFTLKQRFRSRFLLFHYLSHPNKNHPMTRFTTGTIKTLTDCKGPNGKQMREVMTSNFAKNYVASSMTACLNSEKSLDEMEDLAIQYLSTFKQGPGHLLHESGTHVPCEQKLSKADLEHMKGKYVYLQEDGRIIQLNLSWIIPPMPWDETEKTPEFISALFKNSSENSLHQSLYKEGLIYNIYLLLSKYAYATVFELIFLLTPKGRERSEQIIQETFHYIKSLQNSPEADLQRFFDEIKLYYQREFHYGSQVPTLNTTMYSAEILQDKHDLNRIILDDAWVDAKLNYKQVVATLEQLSDPDYLIVIETIPMSESLCSKGKGRVEAVPHSGNCYMIVDKNISHNKSKCKPFGLPPSNPYLKSDSKLQKKCGDADPLPPAPHLCANIQPQILRWKKAEAKDGMPKIIGIHYGHDPEYDDDKYKGLVVIVFASSLSQDSDRNQALAYLWALVIQGKLYFKMTAMAMGSYKVKVLPGMAIVVKGFPTHMVEVVKSILAEIFDAEITKLEFSTEKEHALCVWEEFVMSGLNMQLTSHITQSIIHHKYSSIDLLGHLKDIELSDLKSAIKAFRNSSRCLVILAGNIHLESFNHIAKTLDGKDFGPRFPLPQRLRYDHVLPSMFIPGEKIIRVLSTKSTDLSTSVTNLYSLGPYQFGSPESPMFDLSMGFIHCQAFHFLRTQEQLGYAVGARKYYNRRMRVPLMMFSITVIATARKHTACELNDKMEEFLDTFGNDLINMNDDIFNKMKEKKGFPPNITKQQVGEWLNSKFDRNINCPEHLRYTLRGIKKVSIQVLSGNPRAQTKNCKCKNCKLISRWEEGSAYESTLQFAVQEGGQCGELGHIFMKPASI